MAGSGGPCSVDFQRLAEQLGGISCDASPVLSLRAPWALDNWTLPVVEVLVVVGAVLALVDAIRRLRRGDPAWLGLWAASVVYVLAIEPPLYFPDAFGLGDRVGLVFAHNVFSVELLYDRLPLYIVALYPMGIYLANLLVERLGVFARHGLVVGAVTVGVVHHLFYEIFDQLGPQLRWWAWNPGAASNDPMFAAVPLTSVVLFATTSPALMTALARRLLFAGADDRSRGAWLGRTAVVGLATVVLQPVVSLPSAVLGLLDGDDRTVDAAVLWVLVAAMAAVAGRAVLASRPAAGPVGGYPLLYGAAFVAVFALLWVAAVAGLGPDGTPRGSWPYALACAAGVVALLRRCVTPGPA